RPRRATHGRDTPNFSALADKHRPTCTLYSYTLVRFSAFSPHKLPPLATVRCFLLSTARYSLSHYPTLPFEPAVDSHALSRPLRPAVLSFLFRFLAVRFSFQPARCS